jgi:hypothetical protein
LVGWTKRERGVDIFHPLLYASNDCRISTGGGGSTSPIENKAGRLGPLTDLAAQVARFGRLGFIDAAQMALNGVFERFLNLQLFFAEIQVGWIPPPTLSPPHRKPTWLIRWRTIRTQGD